MSNEAQALFEECYKVLEEIENDGWVVGGGNSLNIPVLLARMRPYIYPAIPFDEIQSIIFRCINCETVNLEVTQTSKWDYIECTCKNLYRVVWKHGDIETFILLINKKPAEDEVKI